jgi:hypothetical protein
LEEAIPAPIVEVDLLDLGCRVRLRLRLVLRPEQLGYGGDHLA